MLGDFNEVLSGDDKFGRNDVNLNRALEFKEYLDECNMLDLGFADPKYTCTNSRPITDLILERIDRCFANPSWRTLYSDATVTHLPRIWSDHCPVLLELYVDHMCVISLNHFVFRQCGYCTRNSLQWCNTHGRKIESYIQLFQILLLELKNEILKCLEIYLLEREEFWPN